MLTIAQAKRELKAAGVAPHNAAVALRKLAVLRAFWKADQAAGGQRRCQTRRRVAEQMNASGPNCTLLPRSFERWELIFAEAGIVGLSRTQGRPPCVRRGVAVSRKLAELSPRELIAQAQSLLRLARSRLATTDRGPARVL